MTACLPLFHSGCLLLSHSLCMLVCLPLSHSPCRLVCLPLSHSLCRLVCLPLSHSLCRLVCQPLSHSLCRLVCQPLSHSLCRLVCQPLSQSLCGVLQLSQAVCDCVLCLCVSVRCSLPCVSVCLAKRDGEASGTLACCTVQHQHCYHYATAADAASADNNYDITVIL